MYLNKYFCSEVRSVIAVFNVGGEFKLGHENFYWASIETAFKDKFAPHVSLASGNVQSGSVLDSI